MIKYLKCDNVKRKLVVSANEKYIGIQIYLSIQWYKKVNGSNKY